MVATVEIRGNFDRQSGATEVSGKLTFRLDKRDFDGTTIVEVETQTVDLAADGTFSGVMVWPNERGRVGSRYRVDFTPTGGKPETIAAALFVPETGGPHDLGDLLVMSELARLAKLAAITPITQAQFDSRQAAGTLASNTLYLVEVA